MAALAAAAAVEPLGVQHAVHLGRARRRDLLLRRRPARRERQGVAATALEAGPVPRRERGRFIEKKQLGVAIAPDRAMAPLELEHAADPRARYPAPARERAVAAMQAAAAVAHE